MVREPADGPTYADGATWTVDGATHLEDAEPGEDSGGALLLAVGPLGLLGGTVLVAAHLLRSRRRT